MRNILLVVKHEIMTTLGKSSFWVMTLIFPALIILLNLGSQVLTRSAVEESEAILPGEEMEQLADSIGLVDPARLVEKVPPGFPASMLVAFPDEATAQEALQSGRVGSYYLIPTDYLHSGKVVGVGASFRPFGMQTDRLLEYLISYNLLDDPDLALAAISPLASLSQTNLAPTTTQDVTNPLTFFVPFATMIIFFFLITMSSGFMLQSVSKEKENRTVEVLLLSLRPRDLMLGKILGLSVVALIQMGIWLGGALLFLEQGQQFLEGMAAFTLPPGFVAWSLLYFFFGYLMYASFMGAIGAMAPSAREAGSLTFMVLLPLMIPLWMINSFIEAPNSILLTFLSLFPLTSPVTMVTRLSTGTVATWQPLLGLVLLAISTYLVIVLAARFFRADNLLSGTALNLKRMVAGFRQ